MIDKTVFDSYEATIGIECHVQLKTKTKLFSGADNDARDASPNSKTSPICFGLPGTLPVLNKEAVKLAVRAGIALNAEIAKVSSFDRKHYFYPDLPKGYQITQLERPTVGKGWIEVPLKDHTIRVGITRAHMEEDAGKLTHPEGADYSLVDLNRAGTPLIEIVSEPDMHTPAEAKAYVQELYLLMKYAGVTLGDLYHGNMRFDVNISVAKKGATELGKRAEIKNLNSFRSVEKAAEYEFKRQVELLEKGQIVVQETRGWNDAKQITISQRSKEDAMDYRYFPDADLPPIELTSEYIEKIKLEMPTLPPVLREELGLFGINAANAETLILADASEDSRYVATILEVGKLEGSQTAAFAANFILNRFTAYVQEKEELTSSQLPTATQFVEAFMLRQDSKLSSNTADEVLLKICGQPDKTVESLAAAEGLLQSNDQSAIEEIVKKVLSDPANAKAVADVKAGEQKAIGFLVGQVMKLSKGQANPGIASQVIKQRLI